ncbi:cadherin-like domain-containing protein [Sulfuricurvum sp.]|uniref:cadherin-like domain-containing protein n=1 Tax=Sulfuricurvum sp. TaxID=2025608 RepID=UPI003BB11A15
MVYALGADSTVTLDLEGGRTLNLNGYDEILLDSSVFAGLEKGESLDVDALRQVIAEGEDQTEAGETAAGNEVVSESNAGADFAVRADGRGNPSSYLTGTESSPFAVTLEPDDNIIREDAIVPTDNGGGDEGGGDEGGGNEGGENNPPDAVGDNFTSPNETYTIHTEGPGVSIQLGGGKDSWNSNVVTITAIGGELDINNGNGKLGVRGSNPDSPLIDNDGTDEGIKFEFKELVQSADVTLSSFNTAHTGTDMLTWQAMLGSAIVASGTFEASANDATLSIYTDGKVFDTLIIGTGEGDHTNYFIDSLTVSTPGWENDLIVNQNVPLIIPEDTLIANDSDSDGDALNIVDFDITGTIGNVSMDGDGNITYDPAGRFDYLGAGETATDTFTYILSDGSLTDTATVTVNIVGGSTNADNIIGIDINELMNYDGEVGYDTVVLSGAGSTAIDFDNISSKLVNIEHLDLKDGGKELVNITPQNVLDMTDSDNYLRISGEVDDKVQLNGFSLDAEASANLDGYNAYVGNFEGSEVVLHIDADINIIP